MMTELFAALCRLFDGIGTGVFLADCVPQGQPLPYLTLEASPAPDGTSRLDVTLWCSGHANAERLALCDTLLTLIPAGGLRITGENTLAVLSRAKNAGVRCQTSADALWLTLPLELQTFPRARKEA